MPYILHVKHCWQIEKMTNIKHLQQLYINIIFKIVTLNTRKKDIVVIFSLLFFFQLFKYICNMKKNTFHNYQEFI